MREQGTGAIVQISSMGGQLSFAGVLGNDAADAILGHLDDVRAELLAWQKVSRGTDFEE
jgi:hypothetical protein